MKVNSVVKIFFKKKAKTGLQKMSVVPHDASTRHLFLKPVPFWSGFKKKSHFENRTFFLLLRGKLLCNGYS